MAVSVEYKVFTQSFDELVTALSNNLTDIAGKLVAEGLISHNHYDNIVYPVPGVTEKQKAGQLASHIGDIVKNSPQKFGAFVEILRGELYYKDVVKHIEDRLQYYTTGAHGLQLGAAENSSSQSRHPQNWASREFADDDNQHTTTIEEMQRKFGLLVTKTLESLEEQEVSARRLARTLLALGAYKPVLKKEKLLLEDHEERLYQARSISDTYRIIRPYMSFFNPELLDYIIKAHGTPANHEQLEEYMSELKIFCQSISVPPHINLGENESIATESRGIIKIKLNLKDRSLKRIRNVKSAIAKILGISEVSLYLESVEDGCAEITFLVPGFIIQDKLPLLKEQYDSFCSLGALTLTAVYGVNYQYHIDFTTKLNQEGNEGERTVAAIHDQETRNKVSAVINSLSYKAFRGIADVLSLLSVGVMICFVASAVLATAGAFIKARNSVRIYDTGREADHIVEKRYSHNSQMRVDAQREADVHDIESEHLAVIGTATIIKVLLAIGCDCVLACLLVICCTNKLRSYKQGQITLLSFFIQHSCGCFYPVVPAIYPDCGYLPLPIALIILFIFIMNNKKDQDVMLWGVTSGCLGGICYGAMVMLYIMLQQETEPNPQQAESYLAKLWKFVELNSQQAKSVNPNPQQAESIKSYHAKELSTGLHCNFVYMVTYTVLLIGVLIGLNAKLRSRAVHLMLILVLTTLIMYYHVLCVIDT